MAIKKIQAIVAYIPVLHEGYKRFFDKYPNIKDLYILGTDITSDFKSLTKDLRALSPEVIRESLKGWNRFENIYIANKTSLISLGKNTSLIVMPDEDVMREIKKSYFPKNKTKFDSIFLRWDKHKSSEGVPVQADQIISSKKSDQKIIELIQKEAEKSSDWWRHVGAAVVKASKVVLLSHNHHVPSEHMPYQDGDPRSDFSKGVNLELSTAIHAEASLIAEAALKGMSLKGASMYVTTFPCPPCAKLIAYSGIKKLYYSGGYGVLDGESILKSRGVDIIFVDTEH